MRPSSSRNWAVCLWITLTSLAACSRAAMTSTIGIHIDDHDRFVLAVSRSASEAYIVDQGYFEVDASSTLRAISRESLQPPLAEGKIWKTLSNEDNSTTALLEDVFAELKQLTSKASIDGYEECVVATPLKLTSSQREAVSSAATAAFGCGEGAVVAHAPYAVAYALGIHAYELETALAVIVAPAGTSYILGEDDGEVSILEELPPPFDLDRALSGRTVGKVVIVQDDETNGPFGETRGPGDTLIRREHTHIIARGAAILAFSWSFQEPVSLLPLAVGVVLHGELFHPVIPRFSILPKSADLILTTVHDEQREVAIEMQEGSRPRAQDNFSLVRVVLSGFPPARAGTMRIEVSISVDKYLKEYVLEAVEPKSGIRVKKTVERGPMMYEVGVLEAHDAAAEKYREEDDALRAKSPDWALGGNEVHQDAVQIFETPKQHDEL